MLVLTACHIRHRLQVLTYELAQNTVALAVQDAHARHSYKYRIVDEVLHSVKSFVATHATHVKILTEVELVRVDSLSCLTTDGKRCRLCRLGLLDGMLKPRRLHLRSHVAKHHSCLLALHRLHSAHSCQTTHTHRVARSKRLLLGTRRRCRQFRTDSSWLACVLLLLLLTLLAALLAFHYLAHLLLNKVVGRLSVNLADILLEGVQLFTQTLRLLLLSLTLAYLAYGILDIAIALFEQFLSLLLCLSQYVLAFLRKFLYLFLVFCNGLLQVFLALVHTLSFVLPVAFVAYYVLQILVALYIVRPYDGARLAYHLIGYARLACNLYRKRRTGLTYCQLKQRSHLMAVVQHGTIGYAVVRVGIMLQVLIVGGYHAPSMLLHKLVEHSLSHGSAYLRLSTRTKLVDKQQRCLASPTHHVLHIEQVR